MVWQGCQAGAFGGAIGTGTEVCTGTGLRSGGSLVQGSGHARAHGGDVRAREALSGSKVRPGPKTGFCMVHGWRAVRIKGEPGGSRATGPRADRRTEKERAPARGALD